MDDCSPNGVQLVFSPKIYDEEPNASKIARDMSPKGSTTANSQCGSEDAEELHHLPFLDLLQNTVLSKDNDRPISHVDLVTENSKNFAFNPYLPALGCIAAVPPSMPSLQRADTKKQVFKKKKKKVFAVIAGCLFASCVAVGLEH
eukprot:GILK01003488.1.p1 GENE.GILK01003488.1~~GILK01003488.1.p1  ORF type:complete len:145 (+),score=19.41 GILK01003488.1:103-537(+)